MISEKDFLKFVRYKKRKKVFCRTCNKWLDHAKVYLDVNSRLRCNKCGRVVRCEKR